MDNIEEIIKELDNFAMSDRNRLKVMYSEELQVGEKSMEYHHGRCDIGSPWAKGCAFDVIE